MSNMTYRLAAWTRSETTANIVNIYDMQTAKYRKALKLPRTLQQQIAKEMNISERTVRRALQLTPPILSETSDRVRVRARELGACEMREVYFVNENF